MLFYTVQQRIPTGMWKCLCIRLENSTYMYHKDMSDRMDLNTKKRKKGNIIYLGISWHVRKYPQKSVFQRAHY